MWRLGGHHLLCGACLWHTDRRLAHREDNGLEDHAAPPGSRLLRRNGRRRHTQFGDLARRAGFDDPHHYRRHFGVGTARRVSAVRWGIAGSILIAWVVTLPAAALIGALFYGVAAIFSQ
jgi:hypothetical protein